MKLYIVDIPKRKEFNDGTEDMKSQMFYVQKHLLFIQQTLINI